STACLIRLNARLNAGLDAPHVDLSFQLLPVGQRDMEEDNPIARHLKLQMSLVAPPLSFFRLREQGAHARVRHVSLNRYVRSRERFAAGIRQLESERNGSGPCGLRRNIVLNRNKRRLPDRSGTADRDQSRSADESCEPSSQFPL